MICFLLVFFNYLEQRRTITCIFIGYQDGIKKLYNEHWFIESNVRYTHFLATIFEKPCIETPNDNEDKKKNNINNGYFKKPKIKVKKWSENW